MNATTDTHGIFKKLTDAGMSEDLAEIFAQRFVTDKKLERRLVARVLDKAIDEKLITKEILEKDLAILKRDIIIWLGGLIFVLLTAATTLVLKMQSSLMQAIMSLGA